MIKEEDKEMLETIRSFMNRISFKEDIDHNHLIVRSHSSLRSLMKTITRLHMAEAKVELVGNKDLDHGLSRPEMMILMRLKRISKRP